MWYLILTLAIIWIAAVLLLSRKTKSQKKCCNHEEKPTFRTEEDLEEYGKPLEKDGRTVDMDDSE